jgi:hypothetical protein
LSGPGDLLVIPVGDAVEKHAERSGLLPIQANRSGVNNLT